MGIGLGYISPIGTLVEWFPDRRGMATGLAVMGFGAGALTAWGFAGVAGPQIASRVLEATGNYTNALYIINGILVVGLALVAVLRWRLGKLADASASVDVAAAAGD